MKRKYLLAALVLSGLGITQSNAEDAPPMTMEAYTKHLIEVYGAKGIIIAGTVNGKTEGGKFVTDIYPSSSAASPFNTIIPLSFSLSEPQCDPAQVITRVNSGAFSYPWCAKAQNIGGVDYEAKRDNLYYAGGRWTYLNSTRFDCQNAQDLAQMPNAVKLAVCP
jgi:hypothetical protein